MPTLHIKTNDSLQAHNSVDNSTIHHATVGPEVCSSPTEVTCSE